MDGEHARSCFRLRAQPPAWASIAIGRMECDVDDIFSMTVRGGDPVAAALALWAPHLVCLPLNAELAWIKAALIMGPALWYRQPQGRGGSSSDDALRSRALPHKD
jgi:hypothetical protein